MKHQYAISISVDLGNVIPQVGSLVDKLNHGISSLGGDEKLMIRGNLIAMNLATDHILTSNERRMIERITVDQFNEWRPEWKVKIESFRRQSGNVQQLAA